MALKDGLLNGIRALDLVTPDSLEVALELQRKTGERLGSILVRQGIVSPDQITLALSYQSGFDVVFSIDDHPRTLDLLALSCIPKDLAYRLGVFPVSLSPKRLQVAMCDPLDSLALQTLEDMSQLPIDVVASPLSEIKRVLLSVFRDERSNICSLRGVSGWGLEEEERAALLSDPMGHRLLRWLKERGRRAGARALSFVPRRDTHIGGHVRFENAASGMWLRDVLTLSPEWYRQLLSILERVSFDQPCSFQHLTTDAGVMGRLSLNVELWEEIKLDAQGLAAMETAPPPGLVLLCDPQEWRRCRIASNLAESLAGTLYEVLTLEGLVAPEGALYIPPPDMGKRADSGSVYRPRVTLLGTGSESLVAHILASGHPEGWLILPVPVATVTQALVHLREFGPSLGSLSMALSAMIEVGEDDHLRVFRPDDAFTSDLLSWNIKGIERWSWERRGRQVGLKPSTELAG